MGGGSLLWLSMTLGVVILAGTVPCAVASSAHLPARAGALPLSCVGSVMTVRRMRDSRRAVTISVAAVRRLVPVAPVAVARFAERWTGAQTAGMAPGVVAVATIAWPGGAR